jgi:hypothetical protein
MKTRNMFTTGEFWVMNKDRTIAKIWITPIRRGDKVTYQYHASIDIVPPYPDPYFGGMWQSGGVEREEELAAVIKELQDFLANYCKPKGIDLELEIIREPERRAYTPLPRLAL